MSVADFIRAASGRVDAVRVVGSAVNPLLWLNGLITLPCLAGAFWTTDLWKSFVYFGLAIFLLLVTVLVFAYFMIRDPDRLQSENYQIRRHALKVIVRKGAKAELVDVAREIARVEKLEGGFEHGDKR